MKGVCSWDHVRRRSNLFLFSSCSTTVRGFLSITWPYLILYFRRDHHRRCSVRISVSTSASHALEPGSIPGRSNLFILHLYTFSPHLSQTIHYIQFIWVGSWRSSRWLNRSKAKCLLFRYNGSISLHTSHSHTLTLLQTDINTNIKTSLINICTI